MRSVRAVARLSLAGLAFACSDGGDSDNTGSPPLPPVATIEVAPPSASLDSGATLPLVAILRTAQGVVVTRPVTWTSANPGIVSVSSNGLATANAPGGPVAVTAQSEGRSGSALVSVPNTPAVVRTVTLTSSVDTIVVRGRTAQLSATPTDAQGRTIVGRQVRWQADAPAIATIDASGLLTAISSGHVTITAEVDGVRGQLALLVVPMGLENVQQVAADAYTQSLALSLTPAVRASVQASLAAIHQAASVGNVVAMRRSVAEVARLTTGSEDPTDRALLAVLSIIIAHLERSTSLN